MPPWNRKRPLSTWASELLSFPPPAISKSRKNASTLARQASLPRLPIPELKDTVERYLRTLEPVYSIAVAKSASRASKQNAESVVDGLRRRQQNLATEFLQPGGLGERLQGRLRELDRVSPHNWLDDTIWTRVAYHQQRDPLLINSNWWLLLQDDETVTKSARKHTWESTPPGGPGRLGAAPSWQIRRATWLIKRFLDYRDKLESQEIHPDTSRTGKWFRKPALRLFGTTRIPQLHCDTFNITAPLSITSPPSGGLADHHWIHVMFREWSYRVLAYDHDGSRVPLAALEDSLYNIVSDVRGREETREACLPVGRLTADNRDVWAANRQHLVSLDTTNARNLQRLESCLFTVSLDDYTRIVPSSSASVDPALAGHIANISSAIDGTNRWYDQSMSLIVETNARFGMMGEHSPVDALIPSIIADWAISEPIDENEFHGAQDWSTPTGDLFQRLDWVSDKHLSRECEAARTRAEAVIADSDASVLRFEDYGIRWIKEAARLSPDAYIQMALQLAWFKSRGEFTATYETASTRLFLHGRTETIRTLSASSVEFVHATMDPDSDDVTRYELLRKACIAHNTATKDAALGRGIDRHLLGLRMQLESGESSPFLDDELFKLSQQWKLSTSGLSAGDRFQATGFGSAYADGYGINYLTGQEVLKFGVESKKSSPETSTSEFMELIAVSLREMRSICLAGIAAQAPLDSPVAARL